MSSILKALKKLEHEKSAQKPGSFKIDAEILRGGRQRKFFSVGAAMASIALFLCGVGATFLYMKHDKESKTVQQVQDSTKESKAETAPDSIRPPAISMPPPEQQIRPPEKVVQVSEKTLPPPRFIERHQQTQIVKSVDSPPQKQTVEPHAVPLAMPLAPVVITAKPVLKVHGIAFQDGAESLAVINGITVSNGSVIEGAKVEEIKKDRVRLNRGGETFEIVLDKLN
jgi:hypothetical protein